MFENEDIAPKTLYAEFCDEATRTFIESNKYLRWTAGDEISYFPEITYNMQYRFKGNTGDNSGAFEKITTDLVTGNSIAGCYAVYPYLESTTMSDDATISFAFSATQHYAENSFGLGANVMVAVAESKKDNVLSFKNACGYLKLQLCGEAAIKRIELSANRGELIAGDAKIVVDENNIPEMTISTGVATMTLDCGTGVVLSNDDARPTTFWLALPPVTFNEGITITIYDSEERVMTKSTTNKIVIERNMIQPMSAFEFEAEQSAISIASLAGVWHLTEWRGATPSFDVYMDIAESGDVTLYQRMESRYWDIYTSSATIADGVITGLYSDNVAWGASYEVAVADDTMTWVVVGDSSDVSVYTRSELPHDMPQESTRGNIADRRFL